MVRELLYNYIDKLLDIKDIYLSKALGVFVMLFLISVLAIMVFFLSKLVVNSILRKLFMRTHNMFLHIIAEDHVLPLLSHLAMASVFWGGSGFVIRHNYMYTSYLAIIMIKLSQLYVFITLVMIVTRVVRAGNTYYETKFNFAHERPIASYINVAIFCIWVIGLILVVSFFSNQSPLVVLTGIGAVSAIFLLVFKDTLLGIVASIQATALNIVRVDDRVSLDKYNIDGTILSMAVSTVKIRNNDNTIVTIPTYMITSEILKNWRGLSEFGARRIKRAIFIDVNSIKECDELLINKLQQIIDGVSQAVSTKGITKADSLNATYANDLVNISANEAKVVAVKKPIINLNMYRHYIELYLRQHKDISCDYSILVRHLAPTPNGLPIEIHAFTHCVIWDDFERIQADIFEHCFAILSKFELKILQKPA